MGGYIGINNEPKKIRTGYIGVDNVARKIKKGYFGVGGIARLFFSSSGQGKSINYALQTKLSSGRKEVSAGTIGQHAVFFGGYSNSSASNIIEVFDSSLQVTNTLEAPFAAYNAASTIIGEYLAFGGGRRVNDSSDVFALDESLQIYDAPSLNKARNYLAAASAGEYGIFAGGGATSTVTKTVDIYNSSLQVVLVTDLSYNRLRLSGTSIENYVVFGSGTNASHNPNFDAFDDSLQQIVLDSPFSNIYDNAAVTVGNYGLFGGGRDYVPLYYKNVISVSDALQFSEIAELEYASTFLSSGSADGCVIFASGSKRNHDGSSAPTSVNVTTDGYNQYLQKIETQDISRSRQKAGATSLGPYIFFAGGGVNSNYYSSVDIYEVVDNGGS